MPGTITHSSDAMIRRLETELEERSAFANGVIERAQSAGRDLDERDKVALAETRDRITAIKDNITYLEDVNRSTAETQTRIRQFDNALVATRGRGNLGGVEYRSAGQYVVDMYKSATGHRDATERLDLYLRAADHARTTDETGVIPDPIVGPVIDFIDAARPIVNLLGARPMPYAIWHRPLVTQHTAVGAQGVAGAASDEKAELVSQKLVIERVTGEAVTYGGYVNVSRQNIDFSQPEVMDIIIQDLAAQYAIETEAALGSALNAVGTSAVGYGTDPTGDTVAAAIWAAAAQVYTAVRGQGKLFIACATNVLPTFGPLFAPYGPLNQQGQGFRAGNFAQGVMGQISGIDTVMSAGLPSGTAFLGSTAAIEAYEQRVGTLQIVEPSVLGVQVAYAGYFTPLTINAAGIVPLTATS